MSYSIKELRQISDDDLIAAHDQMARMTSVGVNYYLEELDRRSRDRGTAATNRLALIAVVVSVLSLVVTVVAIFVGPTV